MEAFRNFSAKANSPALVVGVSIACGKVRGNQPAAPNVQKRKFVGRIVAFGDFGKDMWRKVLDVVFNPSLLQRQFVKLERNLQGGTCSGVGNLHVNFQLGDSFFDIHSVRSLVSVVESFGSCTLPQLAKGRPAGRGMA